MDNFKNKFQIKELFITKVGNWNISLRPKQITIGSLILSLNRKCPEMTNLTLEEGKDLVRSFQVIQELMNKSFKPEKLNYLALMMVDQQVHFHVIPRYEKAIEFDNVFYKDKDWPKPPILSDKIDFSVKQLFRIKKIFIE